MNRQGLVPVKKTVTRDGKTYLTTVWVKPGDTKKVQQNHVSIPDWHFKNPGEFENEVARINSIKDIAEKKVLKEHLVNDLKKNGIAWKEDTGAKADDVNWMRALMAAKKHLKGGNQIHIVNKTQGGSQNQANGSAQPLTPTQQGNTAQSQSVGSGKVVLGTGQSMSKDDAKKAVKDLWNQLGSQGVMDLAEKNGIQWAKNPNHIANSYMQCAMKLSKHLQAGGVLTDSGSKANPTLNVPAAKSDPKPAAPAQPKPNTIQHDFHNASPSQKLVGMVTGILPTDKETEAYLTELIKAGKFDLTSAPAVSTKEPDFNLPNAYKQAVTYSSRVLTSNDYRNQAYAWGSPTMDSGQMFSGTPYEKDFEAYKEAYLKFKQDYPGEFIKGVTHLETQLKTLDLLDSVGGEGTTHYNALNSLSKKMERVSRLRSNSGEIDDLWDKLDMDDMLEGRYLLNTGGALRNLIGLASDRHLAFYDYEEHVSNLRRSEYPNKTLDQVLTEMKNGTISKGESLRFFAKAMDNYVSRASSGLSPSVNNTTFAQSMTNPAGYKPENMGTVFNNISLQNNKFTTDSARKRVKEVLKAWEPMQSDKAKYIRDQIFVQRTLSNFISNNNTKHVSDYKPIDMNEWINSRDKHYTVAEHYFAMRKTGTARDKYMKDKEKRLASQPAAPAKPKKSYDRMQFYAALRNGTDPSSLEFPSWEEAHEHTKCSLMKVPDTEASKIEANIHKTHDTLGHSRFKTKIHGIYRIRNLPFEAEFNKIDKDRNHTNFYYHGTDYRAVQKITGVSGQFVVTPAKDAKSGRMLGDGVYLAEQSSKSMQYVGGRYVGGGGSNERGVLMLCKASLGKVVESTIRDSTHNTRLLKKKENDTLAMLKPHVVNPEWSVKEEKAVIPRLWIDAERVPR